MHPESQDSQSSTPSLPNRQIGLGTLCHPILSTELFSGGAKEIFIRHGEEMYRLTITRNDKLILQK